MGAEALTLRQSAEAHRMGLSVALVAELDAVGEWGLLTTDVDLVITGWNRWLERHSGKGAEAVLGRPLLEVFPELVARNFARYYRQAIDGQTVLLSQRLHKYLLPLPPASDTRYDRMQQATRVVPIVDGERVCGTLTVVEDVTERVSHEADLREQMVALRRRERELQTLADNSPDILTRFDRGLRHVFVNAAVERATGRSRAEFLGKTNRELGMPAKLCDLWDESLNAVFDSGRLRTIEFTFSAVDGEREYAARLVPEFGADGAVEFVLGVTHDVTEQRRYGRTLADQDRRKDEFLATLAHELRNPLAPIQNGVQLIRLSPDRATRERAGEMVERQLSHLVHLVDDLLDIARVSQGRIELRRERLTVREVVDAAVEACRPTIEAKRHTLAVDVPDRSLAIDGDRTRLVQVVANLLTNAAKYSEPKSSITLAVRTEGETVLLSVADTGMGIAADAIPTLWDMFTQVRDTLDKAQGGLGIGLSLVKKLVDMHGGSVAVESAGVGHGSTFTVRLPLVTHADETARQAEPARPEAAATKTAHRVLVVDDNADGADSLAMMLALIGHQAATAYSGPEALAAARSFRPKVVFCDIGLPGMDGYEVARQLRIDPAVAGLVLVALTGWGTDEDKRKAYGAGFHHHLTKPVSLQDVTKILDALTPLPV